MSLAQDLHDDQYSDNSEDLTEPVEKGWKPPWGIAAVILSVEMCERLCYYTLKGTMKIFLQQMGGMELGRASAMSASAATLCYLFCVPGGWLADTIGRYKTIVGMAIIYCFGTVLCVIASRAEFVPEDQRVGYAVPLLLLGQLLFIAVGTGGMKPNISSFGADQFVGGGAVAEKAQGSFFSFFYVAINVGSFLAFTFLVNMATTQGYFTPYMIASGGMCLATLMFLSATPCYKFAKKSAVGGTENMSRIAKHLVYAATKGGRGARWRACLSIAGWLMLPVFLINSLMGALTSEASPLQAICEQLSLIIGAFSLAALTIAHLDNKWIEQIEEHEFAAWCDTCWFYGFCCCFFSKKPGDSSDSDESESQEDSTPLSVTEIRATLAVVPLILVVNTCFGLCYNSMDEAFPSQGCQMDVRYNPFKAVTLKAPFSEEHLRIINGEQYNAGLLNMFNSGAIIIGTPLLEACFYPLGARFSKSGTCRMGMKLVMGLLLGAGANLAAAAIEVARKNSDSTGLPSNCGVPGTEMREMPAFWMAIPFAMIGFAEIMVNPILIGYAYMAAPPRVRSTVSAFNLLACGSLPHGFTATLQSKLFPSNPDEGELEKYYYVNALMGMLGIVLYFMVTQFPCGRDVRPKSIREEMELEPSDTALYGLARSKPARITVDQSPSTQPSTENFSRDESPGARSVRVISGTVAEGTQA